MIEHFYEVVDRIGNRKTVRISETGWPSDGPAFGNAIASPENQKRYTPFKDKWSSALPPPAESRSKLVCYRYLQEALCRTKSQGIDMLWFSAIDEPYKQGVEGHFGLLKFGQGPVEDLSSEAACYQ